VLAGTTVLDADIRVEARVAGSRRKLDELRAGVREVMERKSPLLREADRLSRGFVPVVCAVALLTTAVWYWLGGWGPALLYGLSVVVVACPCAFGLALPLLFRLAVSRLMAGGIVPDSPNFLESLANVQTVVFDKTGTLAESELTLGDFEIHNGTDFDTLQALLGAVQGRSLHPVARAFHEWTAAGEHVEVPNVTELPGRGIRARCRFAGHHYILEVGNSLVLPGAGEPGDPSLPDYRRVYVLLNGKHTATARLDEVALPGAARALGELADQGLRVAILTGDDRLPPEFAHPGVEVQTCLSGEQKAEFVEAEERAGRPVLFIGDGLNDLRAMNRATASLAVGKAHELTRFSSRAYWQSPRYRELPELLRFSRHIVQRGRTVAAVALGYNGVGMSLAALGLIHPVIAALLMLASSITVTTLAAKATESEEPQPMPGDAGARVAGAAAGG
jgi:cation transport ATPase